MKNNMSYDGANFRLTPKRTMDIVLEAINEIIPYELAVILSREEDNRLKVRYAKGPLVNGEIEKYQIGLANRPDLQEVMRIGEVKLVEETADENHHDTYEEVLDLPMGHSCMLAPLKVNNKILGLMTLDHRQCDIFTPQRVSIAQTLSKLISLALLQTIENENLANEKETLMYERTSLLSDIGNTVEGLVGNSYQWIQVIDKIKLVAPTNSHVLILGETGTGKEQAAKAIHSLSNFSKKPFIALNCSALNYNLAESELFGHEKGAFTGAASLRRGRFELADGGTLLLDEVGDLPYEIQPKLLRAIQEGTFERLGSEKTYHADVRIIAATNVNLEEKVKEKKFREDLFYRLNVFPITLPPLRERNGDIFLLSNYFLEKLSKKFDKRLFLSDGAIRVLEGNYWSGNVRELQNTLERGAILAKDGFIKPIHLIFEKKNSAKIIDANMESIKSFEEETKKIILKALEFTEGKIYGNEGAAALLKIKPTTLQSKIKKLGI
ncbi:MAG: sigma 54-interacting transcriptional regulator [Melioribacteraceae bacterium]